MQLGLRNEPDLLVRSYVQSTADPGEVLTVEDAYKQSGQQLVILGPPGSGKTTAALRIMRGMLESARRDPSAPVPELFSLASWAKKQKALREWMT
jgi:predicted NACHT family NTPase